MNIQSARNVSEFIHILARDAEGRPTRFIVPGHEGRRYEVSLERNGDLRAYCRRIGQRGYYQISCIGNRHCVCYHVLAACLVSADDQGEELNWCESEQDAERLSNIEGKVFTVKSAQSGKVAYGVVRDKFVVEMTEGILPAAGLNKNELVRLAVEETDDKEQWHSGESWWIAEDAFLKNDGNFVRLYRSDKSGKFPKVTRLATVFWLDPGNVEKGWQRYTEARQAFDELYPDRDSALPVQRERGQNKLFKT